MPSPLPLDQLPSLALFARLVQLGSFTRVAAEAGLAKSAVSKRIAGLERALGVQLLRRSTRKLAPTEEGLAFYEHCARVLESAGAAYRAVEGANELARGPLRVSAPVTLSQMRLGDACAAFLAAHPEIDLQLHADDRLVDVVEGGFDVTIRVGRLPEASFVAKKLATDRLIVCASPAYLLRAGRPQTPSDLVAHNCLHYTLVPLAGEWRFRGPSGPYSVPVRGNFSTSDGTVLRTAALAGLGIVVLPQFMVADDVAAGRLELLLEGARRAQIGIYAITAHGRRLPKRVRLFIDFLARSFRER